MSIRSLMSYVCAVLENEKLAYPRNASGGGDYIHPMCDSRIELAVAASPRYVANPNHVASPRYAVSHRIEANLQHAVDLRHVAVRKGVRDMPNMWYGRISLKSSARSAHDEPDMWYGM